MSIIYKCRHCDHVIGKLKQQVADSSVLGLDTLSIEDKKTMIHYQYNGDVHIHVICEDCEQSLGHHPEYHELDYFIQ